MRIAAVFAVLLAASVARAQEPDTAAWIARARDAIADARYDTAELDLDRAEASPSTPGLAHEIFFGLGMASIVSFVALLAFGVWLALDGPSIEGIVVMPIPTTESLGIGAFGAF